MNNKDKKNDNVEIDDMNIKSHLNNSLDLSGISVSEDLINRTLEAIKLQTTGDSSEKEVDFKTMDVQKKVIPWNRYFRGFAGVAAAALVVFVGFNAMKNMPGLVSQKDNAKDNKSESGYDMAQMEPTSDQEVLFSAESEEKSLDRTNGATIEDTAADDKPMATEFTITAKYGGADEKLTNSDGAGLVGTSGEISEEMATAYEIETTGAGIAASEEIPQSQLITFQDICILPPEQAEYIMITNMTRGEIISLTDQTEILHFYSVMDQHMFSQITEDSVDPNFIVEIKSRKQLEIYYTIGVGGKITVHYEAGADTTNRTFNAMDYETLKKDLGEFFEEYRQE